ncbi:hypothetical protein EG832_03005 [bacterium]|nr:hypothetical protein [bacterium]
MKQDKSKKNHSENVNQDNLPLDLHTLIKLKGCRLSDLVTRLGLCESSLKQRDRLLNKPTINHAEQEAIDFIDAILGVQLELLENRLSMIGDARSIRFWNMDEILERNDITKEACLEELRRACIHLATVSHFDHWTEKEMLRFFVLEDNLSSMAHEAIGYFTAKLETRITNTDNVRIRTKLKEERKNLLREWMKTMKPQDYRLKAQKEFDVRDRTVLKWLQEMRDEKTAIVRKKDDIA